MNAALTLQPAAMKLLPVLAVLLAVLIGMAALGAVLAAVRRGRKKRADYFLNESLVSPAERSFLGCLDSVLSPNIRVFVKVRLADLFSVAKNGDAGAWRSAQNRIQSKHVDFILCRSDDLTPLAAIELDDKSHSRQDRQARDKFLNDLFLNSKIRLLRVEAKRSYDTGELAQRLNEALQSAEA